MNIKNRYKKIIEYFELDQVEAKTELDYSSDFQLLVAVILSAQCTDKRVNIITKKLFALLPDAESMSKSSQEEIFMIVKSCSYPNNKAKHLLQMSKMIVKEFSNKIPASVCELQKLPGVGRKTANVIVSVLFDIPAMAVDTHVFRVANRIGLTSNVRTPLESERQLVKYIPRAKLNKAHHWILLHGRYICKARKPLCEECKIREYCKYFDRA